MHGQTFPTFPLLAHVNDVLLRCWFTQTVTLPSEILCFVAKLAYSNSYSAE